MKLEIELPIEQELSEEEDSINDQDIGIGEDIELDFGDD